jgi:hypothetical protein
LEDYQSLGKENILIYPVGRKVEEAVKKMGYVPQGSYQVMADKPSYVEAYELAEKLMHEFVEKQIDHVELIYHHFKSMGSQVLLRENYLPIDLTQVAQEAAEDVPEDARSFNNDYIVEPSVGELIAELLPKVLSQKIFTVLLDSNTSEHAARMLAMQTATDNANELIQDLTKQYNKSRQQAITNELLDIIGGIYQNILLAQRLVIFQSPFQHLRHIRVECTAQGTIGRKRHDRYPRHGSFLGIGRLEGSIRTQKVRQNLTQLPLIRQHILNPPLRLMQFGRCHHLHSRCYLACTLDGAYSIFYLFQ